MTPDGEFQEEFAASGLKIRFRQRTGFKGQVFSTNDACVAERKVVLKRKIDGIFHKRATRRTMEGGHWKIGRSPKRGIWKAVVIRSELTNDGASLTCGRTSSRVLKIRA